MAVLRRGTEVINQTPEEVAAAVLYNTFELEEHDSLRIYIRRVPTANSKTKLLELKMGRGRRKRGSPQELSVRPPIRVQILER